MKLIIIIPAYNEEKTIAEVIKNIPREIQGIDKIKIFVINDGSKDKTREEALNVGAHQVVDNKINLGLARTFYKGLNIALEKGADFIINIDADGQHNPKEIPNILKPLMNKEAEITIGNRNTLKDNSTRTENRIGNIFGSWVIRKLTKSKIKDASCGFRGFSRESALRLNSNFYHTYTHETIIQASYKKLKITNVNISSQKRLAGESKLIKNLFVHIKNSGLLIIRTILMYKPLNSLLLLGFLIIIPGIFLGLRVTYFYFIGEGGGKLHSLILTAILIITGFTTIVLGLIGDLIANNRKLNEEILYYLKKNRK
jgi:glycosyltransferase involved in cell wall biosynthesis